MNWSRDHWTDEDEPVTVFSTVNTKQSYLYPPKHGKVSDVRFAMMHLFGYGIQTFCVWHLAQMDVSFTISDRDGFVQCIRTQECSTTTISSFAFCMARRVPTNFGRAMQIPFAMFAVLLTIPEDETKLQTERKVMKQITTCTTLAQTLLHGRPYIPNRILSCRFHSFPLTMKTNNGLLKCENK